MTPHGQEIFSNPCNESMVTAAWSALLSGEAPATDALRALVNASWQRCLAAQVDPHIRSAPQPLDDGALYLLRERQHELLQASAPIMACARDFLAETGALMALADTHGTILSTEGDLGTIESASTICLMPGVRWAENICGTNAIGTALATEQPLQIHSAEHFCEGIKRWTCSATVLRHPMGGEVIGVLDVSGLSPSYNRQALALVMAAASHIEAHLTATEMQWRYRLLDQAMARLASNDGVLLFDRRGHMIRANAQAACAIQRAGGQEPLSRQWHAPWLCPRLRGKAPEALPAWIHADWIEPLYIDGRHLGSLLILPQTQPHPHRGSPQSSPAQQPPPSPEIPDGAFTSIVTDDPGLQACITRAQRLAATQMPVLLLGETGCGKEEFARGMHGDTRRPFVALNCGGLSRDLLASELFGYAEGAFTGARKGGMSGKIEAADGGTLFLDEIGELPLDMQPHLLRVLERGELYRLGENTPRQVHFRLISATHRDLRQDMADGRFRTDLYYRIAVTSLRLPPLRQRPGDIEKLARHFLPHFRSLSGQGPCEIAPSALQALRAYSWPGNVRELRNLIECTVLLCNGAVITVDDLPADFLDALAQEAAAPTTADSAQPLSLPEGEKQMIRQAVDACGGNISRAARTLQIAKSTLYAKMSRYGISR